jgi:hypothetical protein
MIRTVSETEVKTKISVAVVMTRPTFLTLSLTAPFEPFLTVLRPGDHEGQMRRRPDFSEPTEVSPMTYAKSVQAPTLRARSISGSGEAKRRVTRIQGTRK